MAGIKDVAARAGVSMATASRALTGHPSVSDAARAAVRAAADELGYRANGVARSLRTRRTRILGLVVPDVLNPFFTELARAVEEEARALGYSVIIGNADDRPEQLDHQLRSLLERRTDGLLVAPADDPSAELLRRTARSGTPLVFVDRWIAGAPGVPVVRADGRAAVRALVRHLHRLGRRRIAVITGPAATATGRERLDAFRGALGELGLPPRPELIGHGDFRAESGRRETARLLSLPRHSRPDAVFAADNLMALGALDAIRAAGLRVPAGIALAAFDDIPWFAHLDPPLTAIAQPTAELGRAAVRALADRIEGRPAASVTLDARLVARASCGEPGGARGGGTGRLGNVRRCDDGAERRERESGS
ncbi:LacI family DNA-binding transcriptional regulator [Mangrovactinospora gilvigrisea]|uniref:LacI family DNA-binding transcriptional regulator n=1 Tax=Mangrovactinospora gilvigrisea TaxID=1428644 RepID=UPI0009A0E211|nr:LacI family DNA-binding transcriptional regulator [Mangrovactinospora gilvigrisea]